MKTELKKVDSDENYQLKLSDGTIEMGLYPVIYGWRVRAGYVGNGCCEIDWCCGNDQFTIMYSYYLLKFLLETKGDFQNIPSVSEIKPWVNDENFVKFVDSQEFILDEKTKKEALNFQLGMLRLEYITKYI